MTILNITEIMVSKSPSSLFYGMAVLGLMFTLITLGGMMASEEGGVWGWVIGFVISLTVCIVGFCVVSKDVVESPSGRYRYESTIDESVSAEQLYDKYDVIERRGEIWVLEDKEEMK